VSDVDSEEATETIEILATLCVVYVGTFAAIDDGEPIALNARETSEVTPEMTLSEVLNLFEVGGVHI
jgi:hypothetical protein